MDSTDNKSTETYKTRKSGFSYRFKKCLRIWKITGLHLISCKVDKRNFDTEKVFSLLSLLQSCHKTLQYLKANLHSYTITDFCFIARIMWQIYYKTLQYLIIYSKGGSRLKNWCMARVLSFLIRYFSNYYTLHRSDLAAQAAPLDPRLTHRLYI